MISGGECFACKYVRNCGETSEGKILTSYVCGGFSAVEKPEYVARVTSLRLFGDRQTVFALLKQSEENNGV